MPATMRDLEIVEKLILCVKRQAAFTKLVMEGDVVGFTKLYHEEVLDHISDLTDAVESSSLKADMELTMAKAKYEMEKAFDEISES